MIKILIEFLLFFTGNRMQTIDVKLTSMKINCGNRSFARSRGSPRQHHPNNGNSIPAIVSCKASVTFVLCCLYLMSCCWIQPIVATSSQKVSKTQLYLTRKLFKEVKSNIIKLASLYIVSWFCGIFDNISQSLLSSWPMAKRMVCIRKLPFPCMIGNPLI